MSWTETAVDFSIFLFATLEKNVTFLFHYYTAIIFLCTKKIFDI